MFIPPTKFALKLPHMSVQKSLACPLFFQQKLVSKRGCRAPVFRDYYRHHLFMDERLLLEWNASPTGPVLIRFRCQTWLCCRKVQQSGQIPGFTWRWRPRSPFPHNQHSYLFTTDLGKNDRSSLLIPSTRFIPWSWFDRPTSMSSHTHPFSQILEEDFDLLWPFEILAHASTEHPTTLGASSGPRAWWYISTDSHASWPAIACILRRAAKFLFDWICCWRWSLLTDDRKYKSKSITEDLSAVSNRRGQDQKQVSLRSLYFSTRVSENDCCIRSRTCEPNV